MLSSPYGIELLELGAVDRGGGRGAPPEKGRAGRPTTGAERCAGAVDAARPPAAGGLLRACSWRGGNAEGPAFARPSDSSQARPASAGVEQIAQP